MTTSNIPSKDINTINSYDPINKIWCGVKVPIDRNPDLSLGKVMLDKLLKNPEHIGQICCHNGKEFTNQEIADYALSIACRLNELGLQQGEVIGLMCSNTEYVASLAIGSLINGLVVSPVDVSFEKESFKQICTISKPSIMFCDGIVYERVKRNFQEMGLNAKIYTIDDHIDGEPNITEFLNASSQDKADFKVKSLKEGPQQTAFILCSSGTTGLPKGICVTHLSLITPNVSSSLTPKDRLFNFGSLYWASAVVAFITGTVMGVTRLISRNPFSVDEFFDVIQKFKPSVVFSPPLHLTLCLASPKINFCDFSCIKYYMCPGSAVSPFLIARIKSFLASTKIILSYGMSEVPSFGIASGFADESCSVGKLVRNIELKIIDDENKSLGPNEIGELLVRTTLPFAGYFGNKEANSTACDTEGWIHSGDLGYMNDDGNLFIVDRKKDIFKTNRFQFTPTEVESIITEIPDVVDVCVCGIPDEISTFLPAAMIVPKAGSNITEKDIYEYVANQMEHFKHLRGGVYFVKDIPKTPSGKHIRRQVAEMCQTMRNNKKN